MEDKSIYLPDNVQMDKMNNFKLLEKKYRFYQGVKTDFSGVIDFNDPKVDLAKHNITQIEMKGYRAYRLAFPSGVYVIKNALSIQKQLEVVHQCMNIYIKRPYRTNLFIYEDNPDWKETYDTSKSKEGKKEDEKMELEKKVEEEESKKEDLDTSKADSMYSTKSKTSKEYSLDKFLTNDYKKFHFNKKIRWSNVGAQYDWDNRLYPSFTTPMPDIINELAEFAKNVVSEEITDVYDYEPEAVIVNYYDKKNYMSGHLDDGEKDQKSPIFSFTFGCSCIFLMGDRTKDFTPLPLRLDAGDLMVMSGYSRNCYHGVPRIFPGSFRKEEFEKYVRELYPHLYDNEEINKNKDLKFFENNYRHAINYLQDSRINLNFRQVEKKEQQNHEKQSPQQQQQQQLE
ncbi:hypothetical protein ABPG72_005267 [Tetrahymena utriculariae]